ncbi:MAG: DMT family transporter [Candidatus Diapherotrites archaeon]|nr:DMT family transporter [Candidatus Diapherotrites archaeon]
MKYSWVLATAFISGFAIFMNAFSVAKFDPFVFTTLKNAVVAAALLGTLLLFRDFDYLKKLPLEAWKKLFAIGLVGGSVPFLLFFWGLKNSSAVTAAFIHKTMFVWVSLLAFVFLKEQLTRKQLLGASALLAGLFVFTGTPALAFGLGELALIAATLLWSIETIISKKALATVKPRVVASARMAFGLLVLIPFLAVNNLLGVAFALTPMHYAWVLVTSLFLFGYVWTWYHGLALVKASEATAILLLGAVITTALQWAFLAKEVEFLTFAGVVVMLAGLSAMTGVSTKFLDALRNVHSSLFPSASPQAKPWGKLE